MKTRAIFSLILSSLFLLTLPSCTNKCTQFNIAEYQLKVRPTINVIDRSGADDQGVPNLDIKVAVIKRYCDGKLGNEDFQAGKTNSLGYYEFPGSWTLKINSRVDEVIVNVYLPNDEAIGTCSYSYSKYEKLDVFQPNCAVQYQN